MLQIAGGDPQRAYAIFGQSFLDAMRQGSGVELPTEEVQIPERRDVIVTPRTVPPVGFVRTREPKEGEPPYGVEVTERVTPAQAVRRLAIPQPETPPELSQALAQPVRLQGGGVTTLGAIVRMVQAVPGLSSVIRDLIENPRDLIEMQYRQFQMDMDRARFDWQRYTDQQRMEIDRLRANAENEYRRGMLAVAQGRLDLAQEAERNLQEYRNRLLDIQERQVAVQERRLDVQQRRQPQDSVGASIERSLIQNRADRDELREAIAAAERSGTGLVVWKGQSLRLDQARTALRQLEARVRSLEQQLQQRRLTTTVYQTPVGPRTSAEIIQMIRGLLGRGYTRGQIARELRAAGIPPERFGLSPLEP